MAKYTTQVRSIVESGHPLFDFDYPIFDEAYRGVLEQKIVDYYYFREIGLETVGQFKHFLKSRLNMIMPYYNQLYMTEGLITVQNYNINLDNKITKTTKTDTTTNAQTDNTVGTTAASTQTSSGANDSTTSGSTETTTSGESDTTTGGTQNTTRTENETGRDVFSDTPQAMLQGGDYATNVTDKERDNTTTDTSTETGTSNTLTDETTNSTTSETTSATVSDTSNATSNVDEVGSTTSAGSLKTIEEYTEHLLGNGSMRYNADILMEWRKSFINIDEQIIEDLSDLFMNIY